ncbi:restriction endonuclease subunit S [Enterobacter roggenkampii]|uniref:restriction endonuclease subunit S n=1 Tax=Enterobacter roggenkampii TaxID=1812935 RepID=UPI0020063787|nr:restriction endonuclease subunit S [Enterobacter roggenkampii]MCK7149725.1 restriction endonuclease subunit S [Enterobacter roggenkampii]
MKLPEGWHNKLLGDLFTKIVVGYVGNVNDHYCDAAIGVPFYRTLNIRDGYFRHDDIRYVTPEFNDKNKKSQIENDDILIARVGANLGMVCKATGLNRTSNMANAIIIKSKSAKNSDPDFYTYFLLSTYGKSQIYAGAAGGAQGVFNTKLTQEIAVPVPPLAEQKKIAQILSAWDKAISVTEKLLTNSQYQKKALMQQLLTGKKRLQDDNGVRFSGKWNSCLVSDYFDVGSSKRVLQENWQTEGVPFLRTRELVSLSRNEPFRSEIFISDELFFEISQKYQTPKPGDFLVSGVGTLGIHYQVKSGDKFYFKDGNVLWFKLKDGIDSDYFKYCFQSDFIQDQIKAQASITTVGTYTIQNAKKTKFLCPPTFAEQQKIATVLSVADAEISTLEKKLVCLKDEKKALMQQLLTGKLRVKVEAEEAVSA